MVRHAGAVALGAMLSAWSVAEAQEIRGAIRSENDLNPIDGASITVIDERERELAQSVTDSLGMFVLPVPRPGDYRLRVVRIGYASFTSATVSLAGAEVVRVEIRLSEIAVPLDAITIVSRRRDPHAPLAGYYDRLDFSGRMGIGRFVTREQIEARNPSELKQLLEFGLGLRLDPRRGWIVPSRNECKPAFFVDGVRDGFGGGIGGVIPSLVEGIEVYRGAAQAPGVFMDPGGCAVVLIWTQRSPGPDAPHRKLGWRRVAAAVGVVVLIVMVMAP